MRIGPTRPPSIVTFGIAIPGPMLIRPFSDSQH
jgi:hypothetical protein